MEYKIRTKSQELLKLEVLNSRMDLSEDEKQHYLNLKKGYEGEVLFDSYAKQLSCECLIVNDLLLQHNNVTFQVDSTIILSDTLFFYEVKNFEGDFYLESDKFYKKPRFEILNPFNQLSRTSALFPQLLQSNSFNIPIEGNVVFIHPEFALFNATMNKPFILSSQLNRHLNRLNANANKLSKKHHLLAEKLVSLHMDDSPFTKLPAYNFAGLKKGIICPNCNLLLVTAEANQCVCLNCGHKEKARDAVIRNVNEFKLLFPDERITSSVIQEWCKVIDDQRRIRRYLIEYFEKIGINSGTYYK